jgi:hypothetical protein
MPNNQLYTAISIVRYERYLFACENSQQRALALYRANIILSQQLYGVLGIFEIILRNSIDRHFISTKGNFWLEEAIAPGGYLEISPGCGDSFHSVQEAIHALGAQYIHDKLISKLTLGFWRYQFAKKEFAASGSALLEIFVNRPAGTPQKDIFQMLLKINELRNRIAHYEPICFDGQIISTSRVLRRYNLIIDLLHWLGCNPVTILYDIDGVKQAINTVNSI